MKQCFFTLKQSPLPPNGNPQRTSRHFQEKDLRLYMKNAKTKNILKFAGAGLAVTMLITACGSDTSPESGDTETINMPLHWNAYMAYHAPILLGIEEGIFEENGVAIGEITLPGGSGDAVSEI